MRNLFAGDFLAIHLKHASAAFAKTGPFVFEVEQDRVFARCERPVAAFPPESLQVDEVVGEHRLALEQIKPVSAKASAQCVDHAFGAALLNLYVSCDGV